MGNYLIEPVTAKNSRVIENARFRAATSSMQGWRQSMEDEHLLELHFEQGIALAGVFDGHGGKEVASFCKARLPRALRNSKSFREGRYAEALKEAFLEIDRLLLSEAGELLLRRYKEEDPEGEMGASEAGCTATVVLVTGDRLYCANAGDSRAYATFRGGEIRSLSRDHLPGDPCERHRIERAGFAVEDGRIGGGLNLSRAIGDLKLKRNPGLDRLEQAVIALPEIQVLDLRPDIDFILLGCDGVWESLPPEEVLAGVGLRLNAWPAPSPALVLENLFDAIIAKEPQHQLGKDNMSAVLLQFK